MQIPERATRSDFPRFDFGLKSRLLLKLQLKLKLIYAACGKAVWGRYRYANMQMSGATTSRNLLLGSEENAAKRMQAKWNSLSHFNWPSLAIGLVDRRSKTEDWRPRRLGSRRLEILDCRFVFIGNTFVRCQVPVEPLGAHPQGWPIDFGMVLGCRSSSNISI